jgi:hypothetical protein
VHTASIIRALYPSGICKLRCGTCAGAVGQTGRSFCIRHKEHLNDIKYNRDKTGYSQHILNTLHEFAKDITALEDLEVHPKTPSLNTLYFISVKTKPLDLYLMNNYLILTTQFLKFCSFN